MKPTTDIVMSEMIQTIRETFPFSLTEQELCTDTCSDGCPKVLLEYMQMEISGWESRLNQGEKPTFGDIENMKKTGRKIFNVLAKNQLVDLRSA